MAKSKHTFAKRQREIEKKRKAEEKRARRLAKKEEPDGTTNTSVQIVSAAEASKDAEAETEADKV